MTNKELTLLVKQMANFISNGDYTDSLDNEEMQHEARKIIKHFSDKAKEKQRTTDAKILSKYGVSTWEELDQQCDQGLQSLQRYQY